MEILPPRLGSNSCGAVSSFILAVNEQHQFVAENEAICRHTWGYTLRCVYSCSISDRQIRKFYFFFKMPGSLTTRGVTQKRPSRPFIQRPEDCRIIFEAEDGLLRRRPEAMDLRESAAKLREREFAPESNQTKIPRCRLPYRIRSEILH